MTESPYYRDDHSEISLRKVRYFLAVARHLNFGRAAEEMYVAQPALSRAIKSLEEELGADLFVRDHHHVELTAAGVAFVTDADALLARVLAARRRLRAAVAPHTTLRIGFRPGIIISQVVQRFTREHPEVAVVAQRIEWDEQHAAVVDGRIDVAWVRTPVVDEGLELVALFDDPEMIALPAGHPLARREVVSLEDLAEETMLSYDAAPKHEVGRPSPRRGVRTMEEKLEAVVLGHGLALVPASAAAYYQRPDIAYRPVTDAPAYGVALATAVGSSRRPEVAAFIAAAQTLYVTASPAAGPCRTPPGFVRLA
jgi:DNA-binding transcriptional LysR family regulator